MLVDFANSRWILRTLVAMCLLGTVISDTALADVPLPLEAPLVTTLMQGDWPTFERMLFKGGDVDTLDAKGQPLVVLAARNGLEKGLELLIAHRARLDATDTRGDTALIWAAATGRIETIKMLIDNGATVNAQNGQGLTALMRAAQTDNAAAASTLLRRGAAPDITDYTGRNALDWAESSGARKTARLLRGVH